MGKKASTAEEKRWMDRIARMACLLCKRFGHTGTRVHVHHIASGSGRRSNFCVVPLCEEHHEGGAGLHGMGLKTFLSFYRVPGLTEYGLLVFLCEDLSASLSSLRTWNDL